MSVCTASCPFLCTLHQAWVLHTAQPSCRQEDSTGPRSVCLYLAAQETSTWASRWEYLDCIAIRQNLPFYLGKRNHLSACCSFWFLLQGLLSFIHFSKFQPRVSTPFSSPPPCICSRLHPPSLNMIDMTEYLPPLKKWEENAQWDSHLGLWRPALLPSSPSDSLLSCLTTGMSFVLPQLPYWQNTADDADYFSIIFDLVSINSTWLQWQ